MTPGRRPVGATLPELVLGFGVFMLFLGGLFGLFTRGYQAFGYLSARQGVQGEMLRLKTLLQADFGATHFRSIGVEPRTASLESGDNARRDQACCLTLRDWRDPDSYSEDLALPIWDRYVVYQTSLVEPTIVRLAVQPPLAPPYRIRPMANFATLTDENVVGRTRLSSRIRSFACELNRSSQEIEIEIVLEGDGVKRGVDASLGKRTVEARLRWTPSNTVPKL